MELTQTQTQKNEKAIAELFLNLYNPTAGTSFEILTLGDAPDVNCTDRATGTQLNLEISFLEDLPGQIQYYRGKGKHPRSKTTGTTVISLIDDVIPHFKEALGKKLLSAYGPHTALVLKQVSILWELSEWTHIADKFRVEVFQGRERNYGAGIWIICADNSTWPASDALFCLCSPQLPTN